MMFVCSLEGHRRCLGVRVSEGLLTRSNPRDADFKLWLRIDFYIIIIVAEPSAHGLNITIIGRPQKPDCPATVSVQDADFVSAYALAHTSLVSLIELPFGSCPCSAVDGDVSTQTHKTADQRATSITALRPGLEHAANRGQHPECCSIYQDFEAEDAPPC